MTANRAVFVNFRPIYNVSITIVNGNKVQAEGMGDVRIKLNGKGTSIYSVYYVPGLGKGVNLLSTAQLADRGIMTIVLRYGMELRRYGRIIGRAKRQGQRYILAMIE